MLRAFQSATVLVAVVVIAATLVLAPTHRVHAAEDPVIQDAVQTILEGRRTFRFDTFDDQTFWGDTLQLHQAIEGARFGGVGAGLSPRMALALGLKVDVNALPSTLQQQILAGAVNLDDQR